MKRLLNILLFLFLNVQFIGQSVHVESKLDTNSILIGEQTTITYRVFYNNENDVVEFPILEDTLHKKVEIIEVSSIDTSNYENQFKQSIKVVLTSFDSGYYAIKPLDFKVNTKSYESEALLLEVRNVPLDSINLAELNLQDINDIKDIYQDPFTFKEFLSVYGVRIVAGVGSIALITLLCWRIFGRTKVEVKEEVVYVPKRPDHEIALEKLALIEEEKLWQNGKHKAFHSRVTDTVRAYLESRFKVNAMEQTSGEIINQMKYADIGGEAQSDLVRMLKLADMVKFAKEEPGPKENELTMQLAKTFIENSIRKEEVLEQ